MSKQLPYVVVVDDEWVIAETLAAILNKSGFSAAAFTDPLKALESAGIKPPTLLISDVMMPQLSGVELAIQMKALCPDCKVLLFSGQAQTADLLRSARNEGHDFDLLAKPVHPSDLLRKIREQDST
ncbi:response regulator [Granulicella arctica]|uniref:response regulator n=1 Tax=Granulicella arctica TaxID=940613 RepID=UPI0021E08780|nr:response regulator [Granulicella arctica]